jgi:hypothetical protein
MSPDSHRSARKGVKTKNKWRKWEIIQSNQIHLVWGLCQSSGILNNLIAQRFGNWICFRLQMRKGDTPVCWVSYKKLTPNTWLRLAVSTVSNKVGAFLPSPKDENRSSFRNVVFSYLEFQKMGKTLKPRYSECYTATQGPFSFYADKLHSENLSKHTRTSRRRLVKLC